MVTGIERNNAQQVAVAPVNVDNSEILRQLDDQKLINEKLKKEIMDYKKEISSQNEFKL